MDRKRRRDDVPQGVCETAGTARSYGECVLRRRTAQCHGRTVFPRVFRGRWGHGVQPFQPPHNVPGPGGSHREVEDPRAVAVFCKVLRSVKPDLVHLHNLLGLSFGIAAAAKAAGVPVIYTPHNYHVIDPTLYMIGGDLVPWKGVDLVQNSVASAPATGSRSGLHAPHGRSTGDAPSRRGLHPCRIPACA